MNKTYAEKMSDERWLRFRQEYLDSISRETDYGWRAECRNCGCETVGTLHVHHKRYIDGREPWEYEYSDLMALCKECHEYIHVTERRLRAFVISLSVAECENLNVLMDEFDASKKQGNLMQAFGYAKHEVRELYYALEHQRSNAEKSPFLSTSDLAKRVMERMKKWEVQ